jgi:hypothetical protein
MNFLRFPYKEKSLDGVFRVGIRTRRLSIKYDVVLSSNYSQEFIAEKCFDGNSSSYCHTEHTTPNQEYLQIHFYDVNFKIEGFVIQNRIEGWWNLLNYLIQGSNDGINFVNLSSFNETSSEDCTAGAIRTRRIYNNSWFSYFRVRTTGKVCNSHDQEIYNIYTLNMAEFDLFGYFDNFCFCTPIQKQTVFYLSITWFVILIYSW